MKSALVVLALGCALSACTAATHLDTPSGHAEVTISRVAPDKVKAALVSKMIDKGYRITKDSQFELAFDKPADSAIAIILFSSEAGGTPNMRVAYSIAQVGADVRVVADLALITNPGSAHEQRTDLNGAGKDAPIHDAQAMLDNLRTELTSPQTSDNKPPPKKADTIADSRALNAKGRRGSNNFQN
jgi:hypothetical protein